MFTIRSVLHRKTLYDRRRDLGLERMRDGIADLPDQLTGSGLAHEFAGDGYGRQRWFDDAPFGNVVKANDRNVFGNTKAAKLQCLYGADGEFL